jgi:hypothetical protein
LRRVNQVYTLTTSTKVDLKGVNVTAIEDELFKKDKKAKGSQEEKFFAEAGKVTYHRFINLDLFRKRK